MAITAHAGSLRRGACRSRSQGRNALARALFTRHAGACRPPRCMSNAGLQATRCASFSVQQLHAQNAYVCTRHGEALRASFCIVHGELAHLKDTEQAALWFRTNFARARPYQGSAALRVGAARQGPKGRRIFPGANAHRRWYAITPPRLCTKVTKAGASALAPRSAAVCRPAWVMLC